MKIKILITIISIALTVTGGRCKNQLQVRKNIATPGLCID